MKKHYKFLFLSEYQKIKNLQADGVSATQVAEIMNRAQSTVGYIFKSSSFEQYREISQRLWSKIKKSQTNGQDTLVTPPITPVPETLDQLINELEETLVKIVAVGVEQGVRKYKEEKEKEISELKEVVEIAKKSNLAESIKKTLMKGW